VSPASLNKIERFDDIVYSVKMPILDRFRVRTCASRLTLAVLIAFLCSVSWASKVTGQVIGVVDGDTVDVLVDKKSVRIRLYGIDAPEHRQSFGAKSKQALSNLVFKKTVSVIVKSSISDRNGRQVAEIFLSNGQSVNKRMIQDGMAWWYPKYAPKAKEYESLEAKARKKKIGLWSEKAPIAPWSFRAKSRKK
jgi:micrococcal nuclease